MDSIQSHIYLTIYFHICDCIYMCELFEFSFEPVITPNGSLIN